MGGTFEYLKTHIDENGIALLTIHRPDKLNALNGKVLEELDGAMTGLKEDRKVKGVIITGEGEKAFVAGADIRELRDLDGVSGKKTALRGQQIFSNIENFPKPVIALVNGYALGGGAELAMACHLRIATENAEFGLPEVSLGLIPGYGGTQRLTHLVGRGKAMELILTGGQISAGEAESLGLVNRTVAAGEGLAAARELLGRMLKNGPVALTRAIEAINAVGNKNGFGVEAELFAALCGTQDFVEGTSAFLEKRKPEFRGM